MKRYAGLFRSSFQVFRYVEVFFFFFFKGSYRHNRIAKNYNIHLMSDPERNS